MVQKRQPSLESKQSDKRKGGSQRWRSGSTGGSSPLTCSWSLWDKSLPRTLNTVLWGLCGATAIFTLNLRFIFIDTWVSDFSWRETGWCDFLPCAWSPVGSGSCTESVVTPREKYLSCGRMSLPDFLNGDWNGRRIGVSYWVKGNKPSKTCGLGSWKDGSVDKNVPPNPCGKPSIATHAPLNSITGNTSEVGDRDRRISGGQPSCRFRERLRLRE